MSRQHRRNLFQAHSKDLLSIIPGIKEVFVCPICFGVFFPESVEEDLVDVGHVWPRYFREQSELATHQQILLCKRCNSTAGKGGDEIMQAFAVFHEGAKTGKLGLRKITVPNPSNPMEALQFEANVTKKGDRTVELDFPEYNKPSQRSYYGQQRKRFIDYGDAGPISFTVYSPGGKPSKPFGDPTDIPLIKAGFLTSAYQLAFYEYGYRHIMQTHLDPVRDYILESFDKNVDSRLDFDESKNLCVQICSEPSHYHNDPEIRFVISSHEDVPLFQEVRFLDFRIRLPVHLEVLGEDRQEMIIDLLTLSEQGIKDDEEVPSISCGQMPVPNLDHPFLSELRKLAS